MKWIKIYRRRDAVNKHLYGSPYSIKRWTILRSAERQQVLKKGCCSLALMLTGSVSAQGGWLTFPSVEANESAKPRTIRVGRSGLGWGLAAFSKVSEISWKTCLLLSYIVVIKIFRSQCKLKWFYNFSQNSLILNSIKTGLSVVRSIHTYFGRWSHSISRHLRTNLHCFHHVP
jgi:hypothetical protein